MNSPIREYEINRLMTRLTAVLLISFYTTIALACYLYYIGNKQALLVVAAVMLLRVYSNKVEAELYKEISQNE